MSTGQHKKRTAAKMGHALSDRTKQGKKSLEFAEFCLQKNTVEIEMWKNSKFRFKRVRIKRDPPVSTPAGWTRSIFEFRSEMCPSNLWSTESYGSHFCLCMGFDGEDESFSSPRLHKDMSTKS